MYGANSEPTIWRWEEEQGALTTRVPVSGHATEGNTDRPGVELVGIRGGRTSYPGRPSCSIA